MAIIANLFIDQGTDFTVTVDVSDATGGVLDLTELFSNRSNKKDIWFIKCISNIYYKYRNTITR